MDSRQSSSDPRVAQTPFRAQIIPSNRKESQKSVVGERGGVDLLESCPFLAEAPPPLAGVGVGVGVATGIGFSGGLATGKRDRALQRLPHHDPPPKGAWARTRPRPALADLKMDFN